MKFAEESKTPLNSLKEQVKLKECSTQTESKETLNPKFSNFKELCEILIICFMKISLVGKNFIPIRLIFIDLSIRFVFF